MKKTINTVYKNCMDFSNMMKKSRLDTYSSSAAFFIFVSIIPFLILILSIIPYTPVTDEVIYNIVMNIVPQKAEHAAINIINELTKESFTILSISLLGLLWSASRGIQCLKKGLNEIYGVFETKNFVILRLDAALYTIIMIVAIIIMIVFSFISNNIFEWILGFLEAHISNSGRDAIRLIFNLRFLFVLLLVFIATLFLFVALPNIKIKFKTQIPGALFVAVVWYIFSLVFNIYINAFNGFSMYGSLSFVIILLLWLYSCMYIFFIGAQINYYLSMKVNKDKINS